MAFLEEYTLLDELGQGGYATVYKVRHNKLGYIRAIRVLNATIAHGESDKTYQKFLEECKLLLRLGNGNHPNIVHIYQPLLRAQKAIVEMDYVDGKDLYHYLKSKSSFVDTAEVLKLLTDIGSALAYCHEDIYKFCMDKEEDNLRDDPNDGSNVLLDTETRRRLINKYRVIHNDIHSGNIIRREDGNFVLLDFGLAVDGDEVVRSSRKKNGAPEFKSPEKWDNEGVLTTRSDIYSFGIVLYEFLAGRVPFTFDKKNSNPTEAEYLLSKAHKEAVPEPIFELRKSAYEHSHPNETYKKDYPDWLEELIMKCLAKDPNDRFENGKELFICVQEHLSTDSYLNMSKLKEENKRLLNIIEEANLSKVKIDELVLDLQSQLNESINTRDSLYSKNMALREENDKLRVLSESRDTLDQISQIQNLEQKNQELEELTSKSVNKKWRTTAWVFGLISIVLCVWISNLYKAEPTGQVVAIHHCTVDTIAYEGIKERDSLQDRNIDGKETADKQLINSLKSQIQEQKAQIDNLTKSLNSKSTQVVNQNTIIERDNKISQLQTQIKNLENTLTKKNEEIKALQNQLFN